MKDNLENVKTRMFRKNTKISATGLAIFNNFNDSEPNKTKKRIEYSLS